jgi:hypothetical protein
MMNRYYLENFKEKLNLFYINFLNKRYFEKYGIKVYNVVRREGQTKILIEDGVKPE